jgi:hypothetical protein
VAGLAARMKVIDQRERDHGERHAGRGVVGT